MLGASLRVTLSVHTPQHTPIRRSNASVRPHPFIYLSIYLSTQCVGPTLWTYKPIGSILGSRVDIWPPLPL